MDHKTKTIDQDSVTWNTDMCLQEKEGTIRRALNYLNDPKKKERKDKNLCIICYYSEGRLGGAAITKQSCGICKEVQRYSSTATDDLCEKCAKIHSLCKQCSADLELKPRRKFSL